jgi:hypothetical protein
MSRARLYRPEPVAVRSVGGGPAAIGGAAVEAVREEWVVEDRWWTEHPVRRHYYEAVLADGRNVVVYRDLEAGRWYRQAA